MLHYVMLCYVMLCYSCYAMLCYVNYVKKRQRVDLSLYHKLDSFHQRSSNANLMAFLIE